MKNNFNQFNAFLIKKHSFIIITSVTIVKTDDDSIKFANQSGYAPLTVDNLEKPNTIVANFIHIYWHFLTVCVLSFLLIRFMSFVYT